MLRIIGRFAEKYYRNPAHKYFQEIPDTDTFLSVLDEAEEKFAQGGAYSQVARRLANWDVISIIDRNFVISLSKLYSIMSKKVFDPRHGLCLHPWLLSINIDDIFIESLRLFFIYANLVMRFLWSITS